MRFYTGAIMGLAVMASMSANAETFRVAIADKSTLYVFIDEAGIKVNATKRRAWISYVYVGEGVQNGVTKVTSLNIFDCATDRGGTLASISHNANGGVVSSYDNGDRKIEWQYVAPGTLFQAEEAFICATPVERRKNEDFMRVGAKVTIEESAKNYYDFIKLLDASTPYTGASASAAPADQ